MRDALTRRTLAAWALPWVVLWTTPALAAELGPETRWRALRVGVLPVRSFARTPPDLFRAPEDRPATEASVAAAAWQTAIERMLGDLEQVELVGASQVLERLRSRPGYAEALQVARDRFQLGIEDYRGLRVREALADFAMAEAALERLFAEASDPAVVAELALYQGLALAEVGEPNRAHIAFRRMLLLDPGRTFSRGYFPANIEQALAGAWIDLSVQPDKTRMLLDHRQLGALTERVAVDAWVVAVLDGPPEAPWLAVTIFDEATGGIAVNERLPLLDAAETHERLARLLSAWQTCAVTLEAPGYSAPPPPTPWSIELGYLHSLMLEHRQTRRIFHSPGGELALSREVAGSLHVFGRLVQGASLPDDYGDLLGAFVSSRFMLGAGLNGGVSKVRFYLEAGLELALTYTDIEMTRDVDCKHFGTSHPRCDPSRLLVAKAPGVWFGFVANGGVRFILGEDWFAHLRVGVSAYVAQAELARELNFPLGIGAGIGKRF